MSAVKEMLVTLVVVLLTAAVIYPFFGAGVFGWAVAFWVVEEVLVRFFFWIRAKRSKVATSASQAPEH